jgi:hypothetical protein
MYIKPTGRRVLIRRLFLPIRPVERSLQQAGKLKTKKPHLHHPPIPQPDPARWPHQLITVMTLGAPVLSTCPVPVQLVFSCTGTHQTYTCHGWQLYDSRPCSIMWRIVNSDLWIQLHQECVQMDISLSLSLSLSHSLPPSLPPSIYVSPSLPPFTSLDILTPWLPWNWMLAFLPPSCK